MSDHARYAPTAAHWWATLAIVLAVVVGALATTVAHQDETTKSNSSATCPTEPCYTEGN